MIVQKDRDFFVNHGMRLAPLQKEPTSSKDLYWYASLLLGSGPEEAPCNGVFRGVWNLLSLVVHVQYSGVGF